MTEGGVSGGAADAKVLADAVGGIEPDEPEQAVEMNSLEEIRDLR
jgi:hypothetical protein